MTVGRMRSGRRTIGAVSSSARDHALADDGLPGAGRTAVSAWLTESRRVHAVLPASTVSTVPVMLLAFDPSRNSTASATSSTSGNRRSALRRATCSRRSPSRPCVISVSRNPGATAFTLTPQPADLARQRSREPDQGRFRRAVDREAAVSREADDRRDVDDAAAAVRHHVADHIFGQHDRRERIHANQALDLRVVHDRQRAVRAQRGVVDEPVDRPELLPQLLDEVRDLLRRLARSNGRKWSEPGRDCSACSIVEAS